MAIWPASLFASLLILYHVSHITEATPYKGSRCFDCNYSPSGLLRRENGSWVETNNGIFPRCALQSYEEDVAYINKWDCASDTCFVRLDQNGLVFRGCADSWNLPRHIDVTTNCKHQGASDSLWWFCEGDLCNDIDIELECGDSGYGYVQEETVRPPPPPTPPPVVTTVPPAPPTYDLPDTYDAEPTPYKAVDYGFHKLDDYNPGVLAPQPQLWTRRNGPETVHGKEFIDRKGFLLDFYTNRQRAIQEDYNRNGPIQTKSSYDVPQAPPASYVSITPQTVAETPEPEVYVSRKTGELIYQDQPEAGVKSQDVEPAVVHTPAAGIYKSDSQGYELPWWAGYGGWNYLYPFYPWYAGYYQTSGYSFPSGDLNSAVTKSHEPEPAPASKSVSVHTRAVTLPPPAPTPSYLSFSKYFQPSSKSHPLPAKSHPAPTKSHEPPAKSYRTPQKSHDPPRKTYEPPSKSYQPPSKSYEPPSKSYEPPSKSYEPPSKSYQPPSKSYQPPTKSYEPPSKSYQPPRKSYVPATKSYAPPPTKSYVPPPTKSHVPPPRKSYIPSPTKSHVPLPTKSHVPLPTKSHVPPPTKSYVPPSTKSYQPPEPTKSYEPPSKEYVPTPTKSYQPPNRFYEEYEYYEYEFPTKSYEPPSKSYEPPSNSYEPPSKFYEPPSKSYEPPSKSYEPPSKSYEPPSKSYEPPSKSYEPPSKSYEPEPEPLYVPSPPAPYKSFGHPVGTGPCIGDCLDNPSGLFPDLTTSNRFIQCGSGMVDGKSCDCCVPYYHLCPDGTSFDDVMKICSRGRDSSPYQENVYQPIDYLVA